MDRPDRDRTSADDGTDGEEGTLSRPTRIESEQVFQRIVEQATDLIYILDLDLRVMWLNRHAVTVFSDLLAPTSQARLGDSTEQVRTDFFVGRPLAELFRPGDVAFVRRKMNQVVERGDSVAYEHTISPGAVQTHFSTKLIPIRDDRGSVSQILGITRDVTEKREMDQRIYNAEKLASIGILAAGVAHEINNPLTIILGFTDLLRERFEPESQEYKDLELIEYNANHAKDVVQQMLGFARVTEGMQDEVNVASSVETVMNIVRHALVKRKITLSVQVDEGLPRVAGDPREYQQVLFNLVNNAVASMEEGGTLSVRAHANSGWIDVDVIDSGVGIPDRCKPRVFDPFFTTKRVGEGTGLGLSLCYGIVRKFSGKIHFVSTSAEDHPGEPTGSTFTVSLPVPNGGQQGSL